MPQLWQRAARSAGLAVRRATARGGRRLACGPARALGLAAAAALVCLAAGPAGGPARAQEGAWSVATSMPVPRQESGMVAVGNRIYVVGGYGAEPIPDTRALVYDADANSWSEIAPVPEALHHPAAAAVDGKIYLVGGFLNAFGQRAPVTSVWMYDPARDQWEARAPLPAPRGALAVAVLDGRIYALGGERYGTGGGAPGYVPVDDATVYDPRTDAWETLPPLRFRRDHLVAGAINGRVYAVGGRDRPIYDIPVVEEYDPAARTWSLRAPMPTGRSGCVAAVLDGRLYVFGGEGNPDSPYGTYDEVEAYDPAQDAWTRFPRMPIPRHATGAVALGHRIYLPGGSLRQGSGVTALMDAFDPG